jgi:hypothetical protein
MFARISLKPSPATLGLLVCCAFWAHWGQPVPTVMVVWTAPVTPPISISTGAAFAAGWVEGMVTLIWYTPTNCGDNPAKVTGVATPAIITVGGDAKLRSVAIELSPVVAGGFTAPKPLPQRTSESPGTPGWLAMPGIAGAASEARPSATELRRILATTGINCIK